jgi:uncharacterized protein (DUF1800 family)
MTPAFGLAAISAAALAACGGGGGGSATPTPASVPLTNVGADSLPGSGGAAPAKPDAASQPSQADAARFLTQASFGIQSPAQITELQVKGYAYWLWEQFNTGTTLQVSYLDQQKWRKLDDKGQPCESEEMSYEAIWQQWLFGADQLRARVAFALSQIVVISNIAPDIRPYAMSSYMDMLNRNAFGNYRQVLKEVTLHPAMGYYLNMLNSEKDDPETGAHPNENYAREVLQLFSIGLAKLNLDGSAQTDSAGKPIPSYDESVVQGFAKAFTGWSYPNAKGWDDADENVKEAWVTPMKPFAARHSPEDKKLLDGVVLKGGGSPEQDMEAALDSIFNHPNVGPFISRQLIQRLVTSNPSKPYISAVASVFNDNGAGVKGDLRAVVSAILLHPEARNTVHYLESADNGLGQSPLLSPSVFNFFSPNFRPAGPIAAAGLVAPEFQITTETTVVGGLNFFANLFNNHGYGGGDTELKLDYAPLIALAGNADELIARLNTLFFNELMSDALRARMRTMISAIPVGEKERRVKSALILTSLSPEFVIQK